MIIDEVARNVHKERPIGSRPLRPLSMSLRLCVDLGQISTAQLPSRLAAAIDTHHSARYPAMVRPICARTAKDSSLIE